MSCRRKTWDEPYSCSCQYYCVIPGPTGPPGSNGVTGPTGNNGITGPTGPAGAGATQTLAQTLALGNTTNGNNIVITSGDGIIGSGTVPIQSTAGDVTVQAANSINSTSLRQSITVTSPLSNALNVNASAGGIQFAALNGGISSQASTLSSTSSLATTFTADTMALTAGSSSTTALALTTTSGGLSLNAAGAASTIALTSAGTASTAIDLTTTSGGMSLNAAGASSTIALTSAGTSSTAIELATTSGGMSLNAAGAASTIALTSAGTASTAIDLTATSGGMSLTAEGTASRIAMAATSATSALTFQAGTTAFAGMALNSSGVLVATAGASDPLAVVTSPGVVANFAGDVTTSGTINANSINVTNNPVVASNEIYYLWWQLPSGTDGGSAVLNTWTPYPLTNWETPYTGSPSVSAPVANVFTVQPGTYNILARAFFGNTTRAVRLYNITAGLPDPTTIVFPGFGGQNHTGQINGYFTVGVVSQFRFEYYVPTQDGSQTLGAAVSIPGLPEVYMVATINRIG